VALIRAEPSTVTFPGYAVNVGTFGTGNNGNRNIINATGSLGIAVRCDLSDPANGPGSYCQQFGTYYTGCPSGWDPNGAVVVIEAGDCKITASAPKVAGQAACCNSKDSPGLLIIKSGRLDFEANPPLLRRRLHAQLEPDGSQWLATSTSDPPLLTMKGCTTIEGAVAIDGPFGRLDAGSCGSAGQHDET
jgi:hypothetical protein